jgi:hypothetical protein
MNDTPRPRRSPMVVLLDAMLSVVTAVQVGTLPGRRPAADRGSSRRTTPLWLLAGVLGTAGGTAVLIWALIGAPGGLTALPLPGKAEPAPPAAATSIGPGVTESPSPSPSPSSTSARPSASQSAAASVSAAAPPPAVPPSPEAKVLTADYVAANGSGLLGYRATVTLNASGSGASTDWRLNLTLPRSTLRIGGVSGATATQDGAVWTLTPVDETRAVSPGTPVVITFDVRGATLVDAQPTDCRINDEPCNGLS